MTTTKANTSLRKLEEPQRSEYPGGGAKYTHAHVMRDGRRVGDIDYHAYLGFKPYVHPSRTGQVTVEDYFDSIFEAFEAALDANLF